MRVTFVLPALTLGGGNKIAMMYANQLGLRGHQVHVVCGPEPGPRFFERAFGRTRQGAYDAGPNVVIKRVANGHSALLAGLPDADALIGTWWETVEAIAPAERRKGTKFHLVQDHEVFPYLPPKAADVHRLPFHRIVVSKWLEQTIRDTYGTTDISLVTNPVDVSGFAVPNRTPFSGAVGTLYSVAPRKNSIMALHVVEQARKALPGLKLIAFGAEQAPKLPFVDFYLRPSQPNIPQIYASCDFWLFTSTSEGFGLPILEAMAAGTPVIATAAGAAPDLVTPQTGAIVKDADEMATKLVELYNLSPGAWRQLSTNSRAVAESHDILTAVSRFETILQTSVTSRTT
jgi:glycosyltransferase involved in cell wall biosynthesis